MLSYHGDEGLKCMVLDEMRRHIELDQLVQGKYGVRDSDGKFFGCGVGCVIDSLNLINSTDYDVDDHSIFESALGIPEYLAHLYDKIFEELPVGKVSNFAIRFLESIPVGKDLSIIRHKFSSYLIRDCIDSVRSLELLDAAKRDKVLVLLGDVLRLYDDVVSGSEWDRKLAGELLKEVMLLKPITEDSAWSAEIFYQELTSKVYAAFASSSQELAAARLISLATRLIEKFVNFEKFSETYFANSIQYAALSRVRASESLAVASSEEYSTIYNRYASELLSLLRNIN